MPIRRFGSASVRKVTGAIMLAGGNFFAVSVQIRKAASK
jgi:hypothetical protein